MILLDKDWTEDLENLSYGDGYDIRIHAIQVALSLISRRSTKTGAVMKDIDYSSVRFGYYCSKTEESIKNFQIATGIPITEKLDELTYKYILMTLRVELNSVIAKVNDTTLKIYEVTSDLEEYLPPIFIDLNDKIDWDDITEGGYAEGNELEEEPQPSYDDLSYGEIIPDSWPSSDIYDKFWDSFFDRDNEVDDYFGIFTGGGSSFGIGGSYVLGIGGDTSSFNGNFILDGSSSDVFNGTLYLGGGEYYSGLATYDTGNGESATFIDGLLANSIYAGNLDYSKPTSWVSKSKMNINVNGYKYESSLKYGTFFSDMNLSETRRSGFDITIVYGPNGRFAKKLIGVVPRGKSQQIDASGEALFDVIDFIAKDIVETDNARLEFV